MMLLSEMKRRTEEELKCYRRTKEMLHEYELDHKPQTEPGMRINRGWHTDPTAAEAIQVVEPTGAIQRMRGWVWAIEETFCMYLQTDPNKARVMQCFYCLDGKSRSSTESGKRLKLMEEMSISEPTLYRWREEILQSVMAGAIQAGVLRPYKKQAIGL